ncbi:ABC transporter substrate-binding protein [Dehalococcoidia bacterium]|nr:ABC transporter substrate-binding protein [Dehalococcoidia bacterium]
MTKTLGMRWLVVSLSATMLLLFASACTTTETVVVPGETVVVEKVVKELVTVPGEIVVVEKIVKEEVQVPGETVVVEKEVVKTVEVVKAVPVEVIKEVRAAYVTDPATGKAVTAPQYGGTLTSAHDELPPHCDSYSMVGYANLISSAVIERAALMDWAIDRNIHDMKTTSIDTSLMTGNLAKSWEIPDDKTFVFNIREGVNWHDKAPMNGRELTAKDIEFNLHRYLAMGSGFDEVCNEVGRFGEIPWESIEATDNNTVVLKLKAPHLWALTEIFFNQGSGWMYPPEVIEQHGDVQDWKNLVGTGPFALTEYVEGSSITWEKNPNYWKNDEKYPDNQLPYVDNIRLLILPETATRVAAMRSGKVDFLYDSIPLDTAKSLAKTNPEIVQHTYRGRSNSTLFVNQEKDFFSDINVRHALQMAIDLQTINNMIYGGLGNWEPTGMSSVPGWTTPFAEWPEELRKFHSYDPAGAEALLDSAGYPRGDDGVRIKLKMQAVDVDFIVDYYQIVAQYWDRVGIEIELERVALAEYYPTVMNTKTFNFAFVESGGTYFEDHLVTRFWSKREGGTLAHKMNDAKYDRIIDDLLAASKLKDYMALVKEADWHVIENHWRIWGVAAPNIFVTQPWIIGYNGEKGLGTIGIGPSSFTMGSRLWIDHDMKKAMGY